MERPIDCKAGYKHHVTNEYLKHLQKSLMDLCRCEFLHQVDLLSPSRMGVTEAEYWAQRRLDEKKQEIEKEGFTPNPTKFQTQKQLIRDAVAAARERAISYEDFQNILQDEYDIFVKTQRGRYSYLDVYKRQLICCCMMWMCRRCSMITHFSEMFWTIPRTIRYCLLYTSRCV